MGGTGELRKVTLGVVYRLFPKGQPSIPQMALPPFHLLSLDSPNPDSYQNQLPRRDYVEAETLCIGSHIAAELECGMGNTTIKNCKVLLSLLHNHSFGIIESNANVLVMDGHAFRKTLTQHRVRMKTGLLAVLPLPCVVGSVARAGLWP